MSDASMATSARPGGSAAPQERWLWRWRVPLLLLLAIAAVTPGSSSVRPLEEHEVLVARTASEMLLAGDFAVPRFNGEVRLQKPPLSYWLVATSHRLLGGGAEERISELTARLPSMLAGVALLFVTVAIGSVAFRDRRVGWTAAVLLATSWGFSRWAHNARPEMTYALLCALMVLGFLLLQRSRGDARAGLWAGLLAWGSCAVAILVKGPQLPLFLLAGIIAALLLERPRPPLLTSLRPFLGLALLPIAGLYFVFLASQVEGARELWLGEMLQSAGDQKTVPIWQRPFNLYFVRSALLRLLPWALPIGLAAARLVRERPAPARMLGWCVAAPILFLSFSPKLRSHYLLPTLPLLAALMAWGCVGFFDRNAADAAGRERMARWLGINAAAFAVVLVTVTALAFRVDAGTQERPWPQVLPWTLASLAAVAASWHARRVSLQRSCALLAVAAVSFWAAVATANLDYSPHRHTRVAFARDVARLVPDSTPLVHNAGAIHAVVYYANRTIPRIRLEDLSALLAREPETLLISQPSRVEAAGLEAEEWIRERPVRHKEPMVLYRFEAAEGGAGAAPVAEPEPPASG
jgi:4-amino-4-deoxy-L-arabinose transferase-like glycosyltransferase